MDGFFLTKQAVTGYTTRKGEEGVDQTRVGKSRFFDESNERVGQERKLRILVLHNVL